jgi:hypothetical protein
VHPIERLRHVARSGGVDPATIVAETVEAIARLSPTPSELVPLCRNLVERNPTCGPLWWLCAHLLAKPGDRETAWRLADEIERDPTPARLAERLPDDAAVMTVGSPPLAAQALRRADNVTVAAVLAGDEARGLVRAMDRAGVDVEPVAPEAMLRGLRRADLLLVEADACSTESVVASVGSGLAAIAASALDVPVWLVAGRGRRLPVAYVEAIERGLGRESEMFATSYVSHVVGPEGVVPASREALVAECPVIHELGVVVPGNRGD